MNLIVKKFDELTTSELYEILKARAEIFIMEQNINYQDMDNIDYRSIHFFYMENNKVIAYLRAFYEDDKRSIVRIGRVLTLEHSKGYGKKLLTDALPILKKQMKAKKICMDAQTHAISFYEQFGFQTISEEFLEEGIMHVKMSLDI